MPHFPFIIWSCRHQHFVSLYRLCRVYTDTIIFSQRTNSSLLHALFSSRVSQVPRVKSCASCPRMNWFAFLFRRGTLMPRVHQDLHRGAFRRVRLKILLREAFPKVQQRFSRKAPPNLVYNALLLWKHSPQSIV